MEPENPYLFVAEMIALLPYTYVCKIWQAHHEFMEDLFAYPYR
jgi:hypothetical protein